MVMNLFVFHLLIIGNCMQHALDEKGREIGHEHVEPLKRSLFLVQNQFELHI